MLKGYNLLPFLLIRTPLLPIDILTSRESIDLKLKNYYANKTIQEAIYLASPDLYYMMIKWLENKSDFTPIEQQRMVETLLKYLTRMCSRCTPFGLFAGFNLGKWDKSTSLVLENKIKNKKNVRFDMMLLSYLANLLSKNDTVKQRLKYFPNSSLYEFSGNYRYFEAIFASSDVKYNLSEIDKNPYLEKILFLANKGVIIDDLSKKVKDKVVNYDDAKNFILELIENQILVSELEPIITGEPYLNRLLSIINRIKDELGKLPKEIDNVYNIIRVANSAFLSISNNNSHAYITCYENIYSKIKKAIPEIEQKFVFQVDLLKKYTHNKVCNKLAGQIRKATEVLNIIFPSKENNRLNAFKQEFYKRYEYEEVSLLQALDNESGISYPVSDEEADIIPIIDDILINHQINNKISNDGSIHKWLQKKYLNAIAEEQIEVRINDEDLKELIEPWQRKKIPDTISVLGSILQNQSDHSEKVFLKIAVSFATAASMLGRFTHSDPGIDTFVKSITKHEQQLNRGKILAEIVHLPQSRTGNVLIRSHLRDYEIPFLAQSTLPEDRIIKISDLTISISNDSEKIILKSKRLNKEIIPRLSTAHNFNTGNQLPLYRFLCDLQYQGYKNPLSFTWGPTGIYYPLKPRVVYKNVILHRAGWVFESKELEFIKNHIFKGNFLEIHKWRDQWKIPPYVVLVEEDHELFLDLKDPVFLLLFAKIIGKSNHIVLFEFLYHPENCVVKDRQGGKYANEFIMAFAKEIENPKTKIITDHITNKQKIDNVKRYFSIGSEWIYFKIYLGFKTADEFLVNIVKLIDKYKQKGIILHWFFIRYNDPKYHLRIRIKLSNHKYNGIILSEVNKTFNSKIKSGKIFKIQMDTYKSEIERYGRDAIGLVEKYFELQSVIIIDFLKTSINFSNQDLLRFIFALKFLDIQLMNFGYNLENKKIFVDNSLSSFEKEFQVQPITKKQITKKYKSLEHIINSVFDESTHINLKNWLLVNKLITNYYNSQIALITEIKRNSALYKDISTRYYFVWSLNHMFINKLVRSNARKFEYVVYAILDKFLNKLYFTNKTK